MFDEELTKQLAVPPSPTFHVYSIGVDGPKRHANHVPAPGAVEGCIELSLDAPRAVRGGVPFHCQLVMYHGADLVKNGTFRHLCA